MATKLVSERSELVHDRWPFEIGAFIRDLIILDVDGLDLDSRWASIGAVLQVLDVELIRIDLDVNAVVMDLVDAFVPAVKIVSLVDFALGVEQDHTLVLPNCAVRIILVLLQALLPHEDHLDDGGHEDGNYAVMMLIMTVVMMMILMNMIDDDRDDGKAS